MIKYFFKIRWINKKNLYRKALHPYEKFEKERATSFEK